MSFLRALVHKSSSALASSLTVNRLVPPNLLSRSMSVTSRLFNTRTAGDFDADPSTYFPTVHRNILDHRRRLLACKYELRRKLYKSLCRDPDLPGDLREKCRYKLSKLPRNSSFTRVRNRCVNTGRSRAVYRKFKMSRIVFRTLASNGTLMGIKKASW